MGVEVTSTPTTSLLFLSCRPFVVITTLSTGLVGVEEQLCDGKTVENKGKLILKVQLTANLESHEVKPNLKFI